MSGMNFDLYKKKAEDEEGSAGQSGGYDTSLIQMRHDDSKVPTQLSFTDSGQITRSLQVDAHQSEPSSKDWFESEAMRNGPQMTDKLGMQMGPGPFESFSFAPPKAQGAGTAFLSTPFMVQVVQSRALEPEPIYYEKYSSFTTPPGTPPQNLLADISNVFAATSNVDHEPSFDKNKIKGVAYENNGRCTFKVRLYQKKDTDSILCEFQRRSGCVVSFNKFYRRTLKEIEKYVSRKAGERSGNWLTTITRVEQDANAEPSVQLDEATADNLISMAGCDNVDVQREGAQALANVAKFSQNQAKLAEMHCQSPGGCRIVALLEKLLGSVDTELCRSGCVFLAYMAFQGSMQAVLIEKCLEKMIDILNAPMSFETTDSKRQVAMALSLLARDRASYILAHPKGPLACDVLKKIYEEKRFADSSLKQSVADAHISLHNARQLC